MNKTYTLKELADIGAEAANAFLPDGVRMCLKAREAFTKAILDAVGYELPKDEEREAFDAWAQIPQGETQAFAEWKAACDELRQAINKPSYSMPPYYAGITLLGANPNEPAEQKKHADANAEVHRYAQSLIDAVELGKFEDGAEPIKLMEGYAPKPPTKPAKAR